MAQLPSARLLVPLTAHPELGLPWYHRAYRTQPTLPHSSRQHIQVMIIQLTAGTTLPPEVVEQIVAKSDGMPLYGRDDQSDLRLRGAQEGRWAL